MHFSNIIQEIPAGLSWILRRGAGIFGAQTQMNLQ